jgi:hypothetical protein
MRRQHYQFGRPFRQFGANELLVPSGRPAAPDQVCGSLLSTPRPISFPSKTQTIASPIFNRPKRRPDPAGAHVATRGSTARGRLIPACRGWHGPAVPDHGCGRKSMTDKGSLWVPSKQSVLGSWSDEIPIRTGMVGVKGLIIHALQMHQGGPRPETRASMSLEV